MLAERVTHMFLAPLMVAAHLAAAAVRFPGLSCILVGGASITDAAILATRRVFSDMLHQVYGFTEATPLQS